MEVNSYNTWRWRELRARRQLLNVLTSVTAQFAWWMGAMYSAYPDVYYQSFGAPHVANNNGDVFPSAIPPLLGGVHFVHMVLSLIPTKLGLVIRHGTQAITLLRFVSVSQMGVVLYILNSWSRRLDESNTYFDNSDTVFTFCILQFAAPYTMNGFGLPSIEMWYMYYISLLFWILGFNFQNSSFGGFFEGASLLLASYIVIMSEVCHEADLRQKFRSVSQWTTGFKSKLNNEQSPGAFGGCAEYNIHIASFLKSVQQRTDKLESILVKRGIEVRVLVYDKAGRVIGQRFDKRHSKLFEVRELCRALRGVVTTQTVFSVHDELHERQFAFSNLCMTTFAMVEASRGQGYALFTSDDMPEVYVRGPEGFLQMILYLLIISAIDEHPLYSSGVVMVKCQMIQGRWNIVVAVSRIVERYAPSLKPNMDPGRDADNSLPASGSTKSEDPSDLRDGLNDILGDFGHSTPELAASLTARYLNTKIDMKEETDASNGFRLSTYSFIVPGLVSQLMGVEANSDFLLVNQSWLLLTWRNPNARDIFEHYQIMQQLEMLGVPFETCLVPAFLLNLDKKHNVVVTSETNLNFNHSMLVPLLQRIACEVIVAVDHSGASPEYFLKTFGLRVKVISGEATINELLPYVSTLYSAKEPRVLLNPVLTN